MKPEDEKLFDEQFDEIPRSNPPVAEEGVKEVDLTTYLLKWKDLGYHIYACFAPPYYPECYYFIDSTGRRSVLFYGLPSLMQALRCTFAGSTPSQLTIPN